jgi:legumain
MRGIGTGRVIESGPNDHVFVSYVDPGNTNYRGFTSGKLHNIDLRRALWKMALNMQFAHSDLYGGLQVCLHV